METQIRSHRTSHPLASDLGLHLLSMSHKKGARLIWVNECNRGKCLDFELGSRIKSLFATSEDFCHLLITFANGLDPDQDRH